MVPSPGRAPPLPLRGSATGPGELPEASVLGAPVSAPPGCLPCPGPGPALVHTASHSSMCFWPRKSLSRSLLPRPSADLIP